MARTLSRQDVKKLGFDEPPLAKDYRNKRKRDIVGGKTYSFRSKGEWRIAKYLQFLKEAGEIKDWWYEQTTFEFPDDKWLVDFDVRQNDDSFYYIEFKGHFESRDRRKLQLLDKYKPEVKITMAFYSKRDADRMKTAKKYVQRIWVLSANGVNTYYDRDSRGKLVALVEGRK